MLRFYLISDDMLKNIKAEQINDNWAIVYCYWDNRQEVDNMMEDSVWKFDHTDLIEEWLVWIKLWMDFPMCRNYIKKWYEESLQIQKIKRDKIREGNKWFLNLTTL